MKQPVRLLVLLAFLQIGFKALGQQEEIIPQSPEAAALSKALQYPVSYNTGIPDISVPLYTLKSGSLTIPFGLTYHSGGFKINTTEGPAGLGWTLSPSLQVSRSVRGQEDFKPGNSYNSGYFLNEFGKGSDGGDAMVGSTDAAKIKRYGALKQDHQPDVFNYQLIGKSGSFFFQKENDGTVNIVPSPYNGVKIVWLGSGFQITDTDGTLYFFDGAEEITDPNYGPSAWSPDNNPYVSSWKCRQVISASKVDTVHFSYQGGEREYHYSFTNSVTVSEIIPGSHPGLNVFDPSNIDPSFITWQSFSNHLSNIGGGFLPPYNRVTINDYSQDRGVYTPYLTNAGGDCQVVNRRFTLPNQDPSVRLTEIVPQKLSSIVFKGGRMDVGYDTGSPNQITSMVIQSYQGDVIRNISFFQNMLGTYFVPQVTDPYFKNHRKSHTWYLDSLKIDGQPPYRFSYHDKKVFRNDLVGSDAWGYPTSTTSGGFDYVPTRFPTLFPELQLVGPSCSPATGVSYGSGSVLAEPNRMDDGILEEIHYPTGGYTRFVYGHNKIESYNPWGLTGSQYELPINVGGLRIEEILTFDGEGQKTHRTYRYGPNESGWGWARGILDQGFGYQDSARILESLGYSGPFYQAPEQYASSIINYQYKAEYYEFGEPPYGSLSQGNYAYKKAYGTKVTTWSEHPRYSLNYINGSPIYYEQVTEYQSITHPISGDTVYSAGKTVYQYDHPIAYGYQFFQPQLLENTHLELIEQPWKMGKLQSVTDFNYDGASGFDTVRHKTYTYQEFYHPEVIYYGLAFMTQGESGLPEELKPLGTNTTYLYKGLSSGNVLLTEEEEVLDGVTRTTTYSYDQYGQITQSTTIVGGGQELVTRIRRAGDYTTGAPNFAPNLLANNMIAQPIEELKLRDHRVIGGQRNVYQADNTGLLSEVHSLKTAASLTDNAASIDPNFERDLSFVYEAGNPVVVIPEDGALTTYTWGYNSQYPVIKGENINKTDLDAAVLGAINQVKAQWPSVTSLEVLLNELNGNLKNTNVWSVFNTELREHTLITDQVQLSTYTYDPLVGMTSQTDPNGQTVCYEYDAFQRLKLVKDFEGNILTKQEYHYRGE